MTFSTFASPGVGLQGGGGSGGGGTASLPISGNGATITTSTPLINGTQTWNSGATTFTSLLLNVTDTASAAGSLLMDLQVGGSSRFNVSKTGSLKLGVNPTGTNQAGTNVIIAGSQGTGTGAGGSIVFQVAPAGSSGTAQNALVTFLEATSTRAFNLYNTTDVTTNYERGKIAWSSNVLQIGTEKAGTGTARALEFQTDGTTRWSITTAGNLQYSGTSGVVAWTLAAIGGPLTLGSGTRAAIRGTGEGVLSITNNANTDFDRLQFGGTTSSFPAIKRNSTALETKLADDSAYAPHAMQYLDVTDGVTAPASATGRARIYVDTADGDLKVIFADGTVKTIVTDT